MTVLSVQYVIPPLLRGPVMKSKLTPLAIGVPNVYRKTTCVGEKLTCEHVPENGIATPGLHTYAKAGYTYGLDAGVVAVTSNEDNGAPVLLVK